MTQEEKQLLIKDICARVPYGVECNALLKQIDGSFKSVFGTFKGYNGWATIGNSLVDIETVKPYLRPMSSMNEEEIRKLSKILNYEFYTDDDFALVAEDGRHRIRLDLIEAYTDWLLSHHFDYRGLIEMGLAFEAPKGMYK